MKKLLNTFFLFSVLFVVSCSDKDDDTKFKPLPGTCQPIGSTTIDNNDAVIDSTQQTYDSKGELTQIIRADEYGSKSNNKIVYDNLGRVWKLTYENGEAFEERIYGPDGKLMRIDLFISSGEWEENRRTNI